jgi:hypothetical protein
MPSSSVAASLRRSWPGGVIHYRKDQVSTMARVVADGQDLRSGHPVRPADDVNVLRFDEMKPVLDLAHIVFRVRSIVANGSKMPSP